MTRSSETFKRISFFWCNNWTVILQLKEMINFPTCILILSASQHLNDAEILFEKKKNRINWIHFYRISFYFFIFYCWISCNLNNVQLLISQNAYSYINHTYTFFILPIWIFQINLSYFFHTLNKLIHLHSFTHGTESYI